MRLTLIHPGIGRRKGDGSYIRTWQMEPLAPAVLAGLTPADVQKRFYDDRMERIPYEEPTDLVALSVETYTAKRSYQIASEYRSRGVPVVMGGFHPTLVPDEVSEYAEATIVGEAEGLWPQLIADFQAGRMRRLYRQALRPDMGQLRLDRSIFAGKRYLPIGLVEAGRGCHFKCEFCAIQSYFGSTQNRRPTEEILDEIRRLKGRKPFFFFVDDNITSNMKQAKEFFRQLIPLKIRWVSQASINAAHDEEFLELIKASGCQGVLIGMESLNEDSLKKMNKGFNLMKGGYEVAMANLRRYGIRLYLTFLVGYDDDYGDAVDRALDFALRHQIYIVAFNHVTPFPGTPLYERLKSEGRLLFDKWWLDPDYRYGMLPYVPTGMTAQEVMDRCVEARQRFYSWPSILRRSIDFKVNSTTFSTWWYFFFINYLMRREVLQRRGFPLGDEGHAIDLIPAAHTEAFEPMENQPIATSEGVW